MIPAIEAGCSKQIADAAYAYQKEVDRKEDHCGGVNEFIER
ncbi:MAG: hypothetical protein IPN18_17570 [Ignavibacteriales bacterium]|nr:hypothetical protein [Ignavibacteriales bacterium]